MGSKRACALKAGGAGDQAKRVLVCACMCACARMCAREVVRVCVRGRKSLCACARVCASA
eukprot:6196341-Pleurochrysis_carterae.AAC.3